MNNYGYKTNAGIRFGSATQLNLTIQIRKFIITRKNHLIKQSVNHLPVIQYLTFFLHPKTRDISIWRK